MGRRGDKKKTWTIFTFYPLRLQEEAFFVHLLVQIPVRILSDINENQRVEIEIAISETYTPTLIRNNDFLLNQSINPTKKREKKKEKPFINNVSSRF